MSVDDRSETNLSHAEATLADPDYPEKGKVPEHRHVSACEFLCWIGYGRAIPKDVYFSPLAKAPRDATLEELAALLHRSVPDPKPQECPIGDAELTLIDLLRTKKIRAFREKLGILEELPTELYDYAVTVNGRGSIEPDCRATERDIRRALRYLSSFDPPIGEVLFSTLKMLEACAAQPIILAAAQPEPPDPRPKATHTAFREFFLARVAGWPDDLPAPNEDEDFLAATHYFAPGFSRDHDFRPTRERCVPLSWRKQGPRRPWGHVKQSAANPRNRGPQI